MANRPRAMNYATWIRSRASKLIAIPPEPDTELALNFASDFSPCGCSTHTLTGVQAKPVQWQARKRRKSHWRYHLRCLVCGRRWSWRILPDARREGFGGVDPIVTHQLSITASHPDVQRMRAHRDRKRSEESFHRRHVLPGAARRERIKARAFVLRARGGL